MSDDKKRSVIREDDLVKMLTARVHNGTNSCEHAMQRYVGKLSPDGCRIINIAKTYEKLQLAARIICAVENPADIVVVAQKEFGNRPVLKFAQFTGATPFAGRWTPGTLTNQITQKFVEPRILIVTDPKTDAQAVKESFYANVPVIALCNTDSSLKYIDVAIPCNNRTHLSIGLMYWMLTREILWLRGELSKSVEWEVMPDTFFWRDPEEARLAATKPDADEEVDELFEGDGFERVAA